MVDFMMTRRSSSWLSACSAASARSRVFMARMIVRPALECQAVASRAPFAWPVVRVAALLAGAVVMQGGRHGDGEAERQLVADVFDVTDRPSRHPHDVVLARLQDD